MIGMVQLEIHLTQSLKLTRVNTLKNSQTHWKRLKYLHVSLLRAKKDKVNY